MATKTVRGKNTNIVDLGDNVAEIVSVEGKRADQSFFTTVRDYTISGSQLIARKVYDELKVVFDDGIKTETQLQMERQLLNGQVSFFGGAINLSSVTNAGNTAKTQRESVEVSKNGSVLGLNIGGLLSLAENAQERTATTDEPVVSVLQNTVDQVNLAETSSSKNDITTLTGKTTTDGFLKATITTGSPNGLNNTLAAANVPVSKRKAALEKSSTQPATVTTITANTNALDQIANNFLKTVTKTIRTQNVELGNPFGSFKIGGGLDLGGFGFGPIGLPKTNTLGTFIGKLLGIAAPQLPGIEMPSVPTGIDIPAGTPTPPPIIASSGQTNISKVVQKPQLTSPAVRNTVEPRNLYASTNTFQGRLSSLDGSGYVFEEVGGPEELKSEFVNATRPITTMVVHWSLTTTDLNWDAKDVGQMHEFVQKESFPAGVDSTTAFNALGNKSGIQWHFVIRRNGTIQVGRPINLAGIIDTGFENYSVHVGFIGGVNCTKGTPNKRDFISKDSITSEQWKSFDEIIKAFDAAKNGAGEFVGFNQFPRYASSGPGFNVPEYVQSKFNKGTVYTLDDFKSRDALSPEEIINRRPQQIPVVSTPPNNPPAKKPVQTDELGNVIPTQAEIDAVNAEWNSLVKERDRLYSEYEAKSREYEEAEISGASTERLDELFTEADDIYEQYATVRVKITAKRRELLNVPDLGGKGYIYLEKEKKFIHGSQYNEYFD